MIGRVLSGGCLCGAVRFEASGEPWVVASCHCGMCRRSSGAAFLPYAAYPTANVRFTRDEPARYQSSAEAFRGFCTQCGATVYFAYSAEPEKIWMTLGCFDDPAAHNPDEDWYVDVKMPWLRLDDRLRHWPDAPDWVVETTGRPNNTAGARRHAADLTADIGYWDALSGPPVSYAYEPAPGHAAAHLATVPLPMTIRNARLLPNRPTLDRTGFELLDAPSAVTDFYDPDDVSRVYYPEIEQLLIELTGASRVLIFDQTIRARPTGDVRPSAREPILRAHADYTVTSGPQRVRDLVGGEEAKARLARRFAVINVWRSIAGTVEELPLAVCDGRSVAPRDLVACEMRYEDRTGEIYALGHNPSHDWYYFPAMSGDEILIFKNYDSQADNTIRFTPHSAFIDPATPPGAVPRQSIELRTMLFW